MLCLIGRWDVFHRAFVTVTTRHRWTEIAGRAALGIVAIETLVLSLFHREVISIGLVGVAVWPICSGNKPNSKVRCGIVLHCMHAQ